MIALVSIPRSALVYWNWSNRYPALLTSCLGPVVLRKTISPAMVSGATNHTIRIASPLFHPSRNLLRANLNVSATMMMAAPIRTRIGTQKLLITRQSRNAMTRLPTSFQIWTWATGVNSLFR